MKLLLSTFILYFLFGCHSGNKKLSVSALKFNCQFSSNYIDIHNAYYDTLQLFISNHKPDLIIFKETVFTNDCKVAIESEGYSFIPDYLSVTDSSLVLTPIVIKTMSFDLLGRSYFIYDNDSLLPYKNRIEWFKLKSKSSGHVFYVFSLQLQSKMTMYQSELIAFDLLKRIDQISAGLPVILLGDFLNENKKIKNLLTDKWLDIFPLSEIKSDNNSEFLVNEFFKVTSSFSDKSTDSLVNNVVIKFFINAQNITKSTTGKTIPLVN